MCSLLVANLGQDVLGQGENLALVSTTELRIAAEVLLIQSLQQGVKQSAQRCIVRLLDYLSTSLPGIVLRRQRCQLVDVHDVVRPLLKLAAEDEAQLLSRHADSMEDGLDYMLVVLSSVLDDLDRGLEVVEKAMNVGKEDRQFASCCEELGNLQSRYKVTNVRPAGRGGSWRIAWSIMTGPRLVVE